MSSDESYSIEFAYGRLELTMMKPYLIRKRKRRWLLPDKFEYYACLEFVKSGPYSRLEDAEECYYHFMVCCR